MDSKIGKSIRIAHQIEQIVIFIDCGKFATRVIIQYFHLARASFIKFDISSVLFKHKIWSLSLTLIYRYS